MMASLFTTTASCAIAILLLLGPGAEAACRRFEAGLCPGPANCECALATSCAGDDINTTLIEIARSRAAAGGVGGCPGECRKVDHGQCPGSSSCLNDVGPCSGPSPPPPSPSPPSPPGPRRTVALQRAQSWVNERVPYCQCNSDCCGTCKYCGSYRCDCSGYYTYCLQGTPGWNTGALAAHGHEIAVADLLPGDMILDPSEHVIMFVKWEHEYTSFYGYQEAGCSTSTPVAAYGLNPWPMHWGSFHPYRLNGMTTDPVDVASALAFARTLNVTYSGLLDSSKAALNKKSTPYTYVPQV